MSTAAREEAIDIVADELGGEVSTPRTTAERIVDRLLETHSISRNAPRVHRPSDDSHPQSKLARIMAGGE